MEGGARPNPPTLGLLRCDRLPSPNPVVGGVVALHLWYTTFPVPRPCGLPWHGIHGVGHWARVLENIVTEQQIIREVEHDSPAYWATVELRESVLRKPLGLQFSVEELKAEKDSRHIACYRGDRLVGCLVLRPSAGGDVRMRQVAVVPELQGHGIGKAMVEYSEALARTIGFTRMILHARETAVPFYENLGYARVGERFVEVTIPHWAMAKCLADV